MANASSLRERIGVVRFDQIVDRLRHSLSFVPAIYVIGALVTAQLLLWIDRATTDPWLPEALTTTVGSARAVLATIAGGLITSITLLLSMMLVTVQVASGQFSPRTLRDWLGDRLLQHTVGLALGTTVFSLAVMRSARTVGEGESATPVTPHVSVLVALILAILALFAVVRSVDHVTHSVRIGSVSRRIANDTIAIVERQREVRAGQRPSTVPAAPAASSRLSIPDGAEPLVTSTAGWVQQIDDDMLLAALPDEATGYVSAPLGGFVAAGSPLMWIDPADRVDDECRRRLIAAFATGDSRTLQQDVSFGLMQLTDIAVRALSPGINDPSTANDIIVQLANVLLSVWSTPAAEPERSENGRRLVRYEPDHAEHLRRAFEPIRRNAVAEPNVLLVLARELQMMRSEVVRRELPGPVEPIDEFLAEIGEVADRSTWSSAESADLDEALGRSTRSA